jgi:acetyl-CoA/propionyl-CoA carboxylase biotin carboxyl carrier protein
MLRALSEYEIGSLTTLIPFHKAILATDQWAAAETCRDLIEDREWLASLKPVAEAAARAGADGEGGSGGAGAEGGAADLVESLYTVEVSGKRFDVRVVVEAPSGQVAQAAGAPRVPGTAGAGRPAPRRRARGDSAAHSGGGGDTLTSPLQGTVFKLVAEVGSVVEAGALICVIEAMKMENEITAHKAGKITELAVEVGASVSAGDVLAVISAVDGQPG